MRAAVGVFEANCSKKTDRNALSPNVVVFTRGVTKVRVSDAELMIVLLEFRVERDKTNTGGRWS